jgi:quercetin 2,3-dioxygenase
VKLSAQVPTELLLLAGVPLNEPMVRWGPFVMNEQHELEQAAADFRAGKMGAIRR